MAGPGLLWGPPRALLALALAMGGASSAQAQQEAGRTAYSPLPSPVA